MFALALVLLALWGATARAGWGDGYTDMSSSWYLASTDSYSEAPTVASVYAIGLLPADLHHWSASISICEHGGFEWSYNATGFGSPYLSVSLLDAGSASVSVTLYDEDGNSIGSDSARVSAAPRREGSHEHSHHHDHGFYFSRSLHSWVSLSQYEPSAAPVAAVTASFSGAGPWQVTLNAAGSTPYQQLVRYEWDLNADGRFTAGGRNPLQSLPYTLPGSYTAVVRVTDMQGRQSTATAEFVLQ
jgi:hypothetical protein